MQAARLVAAVHPGQILVTDLVRMVAEGRTGAAFFDKGLLELKGLPEPVAACEAAWERLAAPAVPLPALLTDVGRVFVGREAEMGRLGQRWKEVLAGGLRLARLAGELGIGKTRLAAELAKAAHAEGAVVLVGRCDDALRGWLIGQVAAGGRKRLGDWLLGTEQERALQQAATSGCSSGGPARRRSRCCG